MQNPQGRRWAYVPLLIGYSLAASATVGFSISEVSKNEATPGNAKMVALLVSSTQAYDLAAYPAADARAAMVGSTAAVTVTGAAATPALPTITFEDGTPSVGGGMGGFPGAVDVHVIQSDALNSGLRAPAWVGTITNGSSTTAATVSVAALIVWEE